MHMRLSMQVENSTAMMTSQQRRALQRVCIPWGRPGIKWESIGDHNNLRMQTLRMQTKRGVPRDNGCTFVEHCPAVKHVHRNHTNKHAQWCGYPREHPHRGKLETICLATEDQVRAHIRGTEKLETVLKQCRVIGHQESFKTTNKGPCYDLVLDQTPGT